MKKLIQFRIRTLLLVMALIGGCGGWIAKAQIEFEKEKKAIRQLQEQIANVTVSLRNQDALTTLTTNIIT